MTIPKPAGLDCEEVNCPNCGHAMNSAAVLAAVTGNPGGAPLGGTMTQNQQETFVEQGILAQKPMAQQYLGTLPPQGGIAQAPYPGAMAQQPAAFALAPPVHEESKCVCPTCGKTVDHQPGVLCSSMQCPNCLSVMTNSIPIGRQQDMRLIGMGGTLNSTPVAPPSPGAAVGAVPCPGTAVGAAPPCAALTKVVQTSTPSLTYTGTVQGIIQRNCLRCHSGPIRTLTTYDQVKAYADNGLLTMMTQPGGPMSKFLTSSESHQISAWVDAGSPP